MADPTVAPDQNARSGRVVECHLNAFRSPPRACWASGDPGGHPQVQRSLKLRLNEKLAFCKTCSKNLRKISGSKIWGHRAKFAAPSGVCEGSESLPVSFGRARTPTAPSKCCKGGRRIHRAARWKQYCPPRSCATASATCKNARPACEKLASLRYTTRNLR